MESGENESLAFQDGELNFIGRDCSNIPSNISEDVKSKIKRLDLSYNLIQSLADIDSFSQLQVLVIDNNCIDDSTSFPALPLLHTLSLNKNKIQDLDGLLDKLAVAFPRLTYLSLLGNQACPNQLSDREKDDDDYRRYRYYVLYKLPNLKFLDSSKVTAAERSEAQRQGAFLKVIRVTEEDQTQSSKDDQRNASHYTPLPNNAQGNVEPAATFGKCRYMYYGKHSEGNRFIRNNDL